MFINKVSPIYVLLIFIQILFLFNCQILNVNAEYENEGEPECSSDCDLITNLNEKTQCQKKYLEFYSYKLVKSIFNFAKVSIFAGLWVNRYKESDPELFETILVKNINSYNDSNILGQLKFESLNATIIDIYNKLKRYTVKTEEEVPYQQYPSLKCPTPCTYELVTWQTLFGISLSIFLLSLITISLYSIFLRKQYNSLRDRIKNIKYINSNMKMDS